MKIAAREIRSSSPPYIIAELGVNHDGSVDRALELTDAAADAGADAIKLQLFKADLLMGRAAKLAAYQKAAGETDPVEMLRRLELSVDQMAPIVSRAHQRGVHAIVTVFSVELIDDAQRLPWDAYKTASPDIVHKPLLDRLTATGKPLIVSTGASTPDEITRALRWLSPAHARLAILQCVSSYPTPIDDAELGGIAALARLFPGIVGYSDHTASETTGGTAVSLGARVLEKHVTLDRTLQGPDHSASLEPAMLKRYILAARQSQQPPALEPIKRVLPREHDVRTVSRQSITTLRHLARGHALSRADLTFKRPGTGLLPFELDRVLGKQLARDIDADMPLTEQHLA
jgi:N,N'-diacetyllegionaminate synthase